MNIYFLLLTFTFFVGFITRNLILSGWAFFPLPYFGFNFKWAVPLSEVKDFSNTVTAWARLPGPKYLSSLNVGFWGWLINWFNNNKSNLYYLFTVISLTFVYIFPEISLKEVRV
jgi:hypothetical protein